eukprot:1490601-Rhodomonas_salina.1
MMMIQHGCLLATRTGYNEQPFADNVWLRCQWTFSEARADTRGGEQLQSSYTPKSNARSRIPGSNQFKPSHSSSGVAPRVPGYPGTVRIPSRALRAH